MFTWTFSALLLLSVVTVFWEGWSVDWGQGLELARQEILPLEPCPKSVSFYFVSQVGFHGCFVRAGFETQSFYLYYLSSWDHRQVPKCPAGFLDRVMLTLAGSGLNLLSSSLCLLSIGIAGMCHNTQQKRKLFLNID
jgi:hypothetical protein